MNKKSIFTISLLVVLGLISSCKNATVNLQTVPSPISSSKTQVIASPTPNSSVNLNPISSPSKEPDILKKLIIPDNFLILSFYDYYSAELKWKGITGAKFYRIYQDEKLIADNITNLIYNVKNLTPNTDYIFDIVAVNDAGESNKSRVKMRTSISGNSSNSNSNNGNNYSPISNPVISTSQNIIFVDQSVEESGDGSAWNKAYKDLQEAIKLPNLNGKQIWIADGMYYPGYERTDSFIIPAGIKIYGGFSGNEDNINRRKKDINNNFVNETIFSGDIYQDDISSNIIMSEGNKNNSYHIVKIQNDSNNPSTVDGITITSAYGDGKNIPNNYGGGILINNASPNINNVTFSNNFALYGGAIFNEDASSTNITNSKFINNYAARDGGAIYSSNWYLDKMKINIANSIFTDNYSISDGGAIYMSNWSLNTMSLSSYKLMSNIAINNNFTASVSKSIFTNNKAGKAGGAIFNDNSILNLSDSSFNGNTAVDSGKAIFNFESEYNSINNLINISDISNRPNI